MQQQGGGVAAGWIVVEMAEAALTGQQDVTVFCELAEPGTCGLLQQWRRAA
ncbi:hypothetical protein [Streptomyces sp. NPDC049744]|uniref:hypothetical protein n=1 Tax=Streptomyces sp. NPDC049744 TaxID=3154359 RepID=UPI0034260ECC